MQKCGCERQYGLITVNLSLFYQQRETPERGRGRRTNFKTDDLQYQAFHKPLLQNTIFRRVENLISHARLISR